MEPIIVSQDYTEAVKRELTIRKGHFISAFIANKQGTREDGEKAWNLSQAGKRKFHELMELSGTQVMEWKELEKPLRQWLENQGKAEAWTKEQIQNSINARKIEFETNQIRVKARAGVIYDVNADFLKALDEADEEKLHLYLHRSDCDNFIRLAITHLAKKLKKKR